jgi:hypothetical protein
MRPASVARWGSWVAAAGGRNRQRASTAAVEKAEEKMRQHPNSFFGHRKEGYVRTDFIEITVVWLRNQQCEPI